MPCPSGLGHMVENAFWSWSKKFQQLGKCCFMSGDIIPHEPNMFQHTDERVWWVDSCHFFNGEKRVKPLLQLQNRTLARERKSTKFQDENFRLQSHTMNKLFHSRNFAFKQADKTSKRRHEPAVTSRPSRGVWVSGRLFSFFDSILSCTSQVILNVI